MAGIIFQEEGDFHAGALILVDKPLHWTSFDIVNKIRSCLKPLCGNLKVGHAGTLDPLATGLVMVCTGKWTKRIEEFMADEKEYVAGIRFGAVTPSYDLETQPEGSFPTGHIDEACLQETLRGFLGVISQVPPAYSAIRVGGDRAYKKARKGGALDICAAKALTSVPWQMTSAGLAAVEPTSPPCAAQGTDASAWKKQIKWKNWLLFSKKSNNLRSFKEIGLPAGYPQGTQVETVIQLKHIAHETIQIQI